MKAFEAVADALVAAQVDVVFGLMGDGNLRLIPHLTHEVGMRVVGARHESAALAMADGYARTSGKVGICTVTQGPGLTNTLTALVSARKARTPLVLLAGDTPTAVRGLPQDTDQDAVFAAAGVPVQPFAAATAAADVAAAIARARAESRPIGMSLPTDVQEAEHGGQTRPAGTGPVAPGPAGPDSAGAEPAPSRAGGASAPDPAALRQAADLLWAAERPVLIAGRGVVRSPGGREAAVALADHTGALLATSLPAKSLFAGHPFDLGIAGGFSHAVAAELIRDADVVVAVGASVNHFTSRGGTLFGRGATLVHVDADPGALSAYTPAALGVVGDAVAVLEALLADVRQRGEPRAGYRSPALAARIAAHRRADEFADASGDGVVDPRSLCEALDGLLPDRRVLVTDGGHFCGFPAMHLRVPDPGAFVFALDFGAVGLGLGTAIGAALGRPDHLGVLAIGDGGLLMSLGDLDSAVRAHVPLLVVVLNDAAYGAEMHFLRMMGLPDEDSLFATPDLAAVARSLGTDGLSVRSLADLDAVADRLADGLVRPLVVDCHISRDVRAAWLEEAFARSTH